MTYAVRFYPAILPPQASHQRAKHVLTPRWCIIVFLDFTRLPRITLSWLPDQTLPGQNLTRTNFFFNRRSLAGPQEMRFPRHGPVVQHERFHTGKRYSLSGQWDMEREHSPGMLRCFYSPLCGLSQVKAFFVSHHLVLNKFLHKFHLFIYFSLQRSFVCLLELYTKRK